MDQDSKEDSNRSRIKRRERERKTRKIKTREREREKKKKDKKREANESETKDEVRFDYLEEEDSSLFGLLPLVIDLFPSIFESPFPSAWALLRASVLAISSIILAIPPIGAVLAPPPLPVESRSESLPGVFFSLAFARAEAKFDMAGGCGGFDAGDRPAVPVIGLLVLLLVLLLILFPDGSGGGFGAPNNPPGGGGGGGGGGAPDDIGGGGGA